MLVMGKFMLIGSSRGRRGSRFEVAIIPNACILEKSEVVVIAHGRARGGVTEFRQPLQVQSHLEMPRILVQLGHTQRTWKLAPQTDPKWSPTCILTRFQPICPLSARDGRYSCQVSRAHRTHSRL